MAQGAQVGGHPARHAHPAAPPSRVVATAGHVDHGKSTLVEWLTGTNPDRLEEERRRGLTIDLGFASTVLDSGIQVGFVDVPGHVRFLKNMLAGVGAVDACMFVVAATEGWKPQSEDHLRVLELVGAGHGVVALTHAAMVDADRLEEVRAQVADHLIGTFLETAPVVPVDVPAGMGTDGPDGFRTALEAMIAQVPPAADSGRPRLWIDRSFAIRGAGTVVTGTLAGGLVAVGDHMTIASARSAEGIPVRVRGLESYGRRMAEAEPGRRLAVNLTGADRHMVARGAALVRPGQWHRCSTADASLRVLPAATHPLSRRGAYLAHVGTGEQTVRLRVLGSRTAIEPGEEGLVRLWFSSPLPLAPGDRFILRDAGRREVVGGGEMLDVAPVLPASRARPTISAARVVAERGWVEADELERLTGRPPEPTLPTLGRWVVDPEALDRMRQEVEQRLRAAGPTGLDVSELDERQRAVISSVEGLAVSHGIARLGPASEGPSDGARRRTDDGAAAPPAGDLRSDAARRAGTPALAGDEDLLLHPYLLSLRKTPFTPPPPDGVDRNDLRRLVRSGLVVETGGVWFAASAVDDAAARVAALLERSPEGVRVSDVRDALDASRRYVLPLLAHLDATGVTRRRGELRVGGPMLPRARPDNDEEVRP